MTEANRLLVISHPVQASISPKELEHVLRSEQNGASLTHVEIAPVRAAVGTHYDLDWDTVLEAQERLFSERVKPELLEHHGLSYFGLAPIPLAIHLGYRVQSCANIEVHQKHHVRQTWDWGLEGFQETNLLLEPIQPPRYASTDRGSVVIRVSTSARIDPKDTAEVVPESLYELDIALKAPNRDALESRSALVEVIKAYNRGLAQVREFFPKCTAIHLFAAVPGGLAFMLGTQLNPTMFPEIVTYQYGVNRSPAYRRAIVLADKSASSLGMGAEPLASFLRDAKYDWSKGDAEWFHGVMTDAYGHETEAQLLLAKAQVDTERVHFKQPARLFWKEALEVAASAGRLKELVRCALADQGVAAYHPKIRQFTQTYGS